MNRILSKIINFNKDINGIETIEYALMAALVAIAIIVGGAMMGNAANEKFYNTAMVMNGSG